MLGTERISKTANMSYFYVQYTLTHNNSSLQVCQLMLGTSRRVLTYFPTLKYAAGCIYLYCAINPVASSCCTCYGAVVWK